MGIFYCPVNIAVDANKPRDLRIDLNNIYGIRVGANKSGLVETENLVSAL